jgi:hypothetical protein
LNVGGHLHTEREIVMYIQSKNVHKSDYDKRQN